MILFCLVVINAQKFSAKQINEDINYLKMVIVGNYPYLDVHKRKDGFDWEKTIATININKNNLSIKDATKIFEKYIKGLNGHVHFLDDKQYAYYVNGYRSILKDHPEYDVWVKILTSKKSESTYINSDLNKIVPISNQSGKKKRFDRELLGKIIYISIPTFDAYYENEEGGKIVEYLKEMSDPSKSIVFDIRGNSGGSDLFWINSIVKPMISKNIDYVNYSLFMAGKESIPYLNAEKVKLTNTKYLPKLLKRDESAKFKYFYKDEQKIESTRSKIPYKNVFVLMDKSNFSSSETFVHFCKQTGFATLVGQRSSGDGIGFDPILIQLPNTGLIFTIPIDAALNSDGTLNYEYGTEPDIELGININSKEYIFDLINKQS